MKITKKVVIDGAVVAVSVEDETVTARSHGGCEVLIRIVADTMEDRPPPEPDQTQGNAT